MLQAQARCRATSVRTSPTRSSRSRVLQRRPASGHRGSRPDRRPERASYRQRAHRGRAGVRPGQEEGTDHPGLRPRRRHVRRLAASRSATASVEVRAPPTATTTSAATTGTTDRRMAGRQFKRHRGHRPDQDKMAMQRLREAAEKAKIEPPARRARRSTCPHHRRRRQGPLFLDEQLTRSEFQKITEDLLERTMAVPVGHQGRRHRGRRDRPRRAGRRFDPHARGHRSGQGTTGGKEPNRGRQPDEVVAVGAALQAGVLKAR